MQITPTGKKTFIANINSRPSLKLSKSIERHMTSKNIESQICDEKVVGENEPLKSERNPNFQYYFFEKKNSQQLLKNLRNNSSVKNLYEKELKKQKNLSKELNNLTQKTFDRLSQDDAPFYKKQRPQPIQNDPQLAEYGLFYNKIERQKIKPLNHRFQKVRQNMQNLTKYKGTKGMVSPKRIQTELSLENELKLQKNFSQSQYHLGLCPFQYKNTIAGRLQTCSSHDLRMDLSKTHKKVNIQKVWYNTTNKQVERDHEKYKDIRQTIENEQKIKKCHSFDSYKGHKLFESKIKKSKQASNDKFYDGKGEGKDMNFYSKWKTQNHIDIGKATDRPEYPEKLGPNLDIDFSKKNSKRGSSRKNQMGISQSERNLIFSRQIINSARGCYR